MGKSHEELILGVSYMNIWENPSLEQILGVSHSRKSVWKNMKSHFHQTFGDLPGGGWTSDGGEQQNGYGMSQPSSGNGLMSFKTSSSCE